MRNGWSKTITGFIPETGRIAWLTNFGKVAFMGRSNGGLFG